MSLSFFDTWNDAETHAGDAFSSLIPGGNNYSNLLTPYHSYKDFALVSLAPFYAPLAFAAYTLLSLLISILSTIAILLSYIVVGFAYLAENEELSSSSTNFLHESQKYALLNACLALIFLSLTLISGPYAFVNFITRTTATLINNEPTASAISTESEPDLFIMNNIRNP